MAQWVRVLAAKPNSLGLTRETQTLKESLKSQVLSPPHELHGTRMRTHAK